MRQFRELVIEHFLGAAQDNVTTLTRRHAAQNQYMAELIEVRIVRDSISHITANGLEDLLGSRLPVVGHFLNRFEFLRGTEALVQIDPSLGSQPKDRLLGEILRPATPITRPFIDGSRGVIVQGRRPVRLTKW